MTWAVRFEEVSKRYRGGGPRYASLRHDLTGGLRRVSSWLSGKGRELQGTLALDRVSFDVQLGESFAIIGPNGAGKTTALKIISRISYPTAGRVRVRGRVGSLIDVGSGVHPELSGRENIWLFGQILGMSRREIGRRFEQIVEFAELSHVLDTPLKMYSSGMQMRLGFAIASHLDPDVFVVDEALAVGDAGFQSKCVEHMSKLVTEGRTLLFVSHNLSAVEAMCRRGTFLLDGRVQAEGSTREVLRSYLDWVDGAHQARLTGHSNPRPSRYLMLEQVTCHGPAGEERYAFRTGDDIEVRLRFRALAAVARPHVSVGISDGRPGTLAVCSMLLDGGAPDLVDGQTVISLRIQALPLLPRVYELWCSVRSEHGFGDLFDWQLIGSFRVAQGPAFVGPAALALASTGGPVDLRHTWTVTSCP